MTAGSAVDRPAGPQLSSRTILLGVVALALVVRVALLLWAQARGLVLDNEGVEYCRIAENLLAGRGFRGIFDNGPQLNFPPLYPWLIAAVSLVGPSIELSARLVSLVLGTALVIPVVRIADRVHGRRAALIAGGLVAFHPLMVAGSISTYAEGPYLTLILFVLDYTIAWIDERRLRQAVLAGLFAGLAYLTRPEAFLLVGALGAVGLLWWLLKRERATLTAVGALIAVFVGCALPYVIFLTVHTGKPQLEAKGQLAYIWGQRLRAGMPYWESSNGIGEDLSPEGVFMRPNLDVLRSGSPSKGEMIKYLAATGPKSVKTIVRQLTSSETLGSPLLAMLAFVGLVGRAWDRRRFIREGVLVGSFFITVLALASVQEFWLRYFYSFMGLLLVWGGKGADELGHWAERTAGAVRPGAWNRRLGQAFAWAAAVAVLFLSLQALPHEGLVKDAQMTERRAAGDWLAQQAPGRTWVMGVSLVPPYYAGASFKYLPYAKSELAIRYVAKERPSFIILHELDRTEFPYMAQWFDQGIPDSRAQLIYDEGGPGRERIKIYRWLDAGPHP
jgi:4-amino-4-deoxy-L-arabinose transferase-like glycosyltransferase